MGYWSDIEDGDLLVCISNMGYGGIEIPITIGKYYRVIDSVYLNERIVDIIGDDGKYNYYDLNYFLKPKEYRSLVIDNILS